MRISIDIPKRVLSLLCDPSCSSYLHIGRRGELFIGHKLWRHHWRYEGRQGAVHGVVHGGVDEVHWDREDDCTVVLSGDAVESLEISQLQ